MENKIIGLPPIITKQSSVLILGSMPSVLSLEQQEYYGNPRNHFWKIIFSLFNEAPAQDYQDKIVFVKKHHIALWDTIGSCYREGSLDSSIKDEEPNDILNLLREFPSIQLIACNGTKSYTTLIKYFPLKALTGVEVMKLPSSSPIPGRFNKTLEGKIEDWERILEYL